MLLNLVFCDVKESAQSTFNAAARINPQADRFAVVHVVDGQIGRLQSAPQDAAQESGQNVFAMYTCSRPSVKACQCLDALIHQS